MTVYYVGRVCACPSDELRHHGILGMRWGKRNGPPYPLDPKDRSAREKKMARSGRLDKGGKNSDNKAQKRRQGLSDSQKTAIKIGVAVGVAALVTYGAYRCGALESLAGSVGRNPVSEGRSAFSRMVGENGTIDMDSLAKQMAEQSRKMADLHARDMATAKAGSLARPGRIKEGIEETLRKANPLRGTPEDTNSCTAASIAGVLRAMGFNVQSKGTGGKMQNLLGVVEDCFDVADRDKYEARGSAFAKSAKDAADLLVRRFGQNAKGVCDVTWKDGTSGHAFAWVIKDGRVGFFDPRYGWNGTATVKTVWGSGQVDVNGFVQIARLDNLDESKIHFDRLSKWLTFLK